MAEEFMATDLNNDSITDQAGSRRIEDDSKQEGTPAMKVH